LGNPLALHVDRRLADSLHERSHAADPKAARQSSFVIDLKIAGAQIEGHPLAADRSDRPNYVLPPPLLLIIGAALIVLLRIVAPVHFLPSAVSLAAGIPLLVLAAGLMGWGIWSLSRHGETPYPYRPTERLLTGGALRVSRNPIYAADLLTLLGLAVLLDTATGLAVVAATGLLAHNVITAEERYLEAKFGDEYREYRSRVRRWI
jgi:protein-S-isoprenylcysteine O-methyltransferase Ste14